MRSYAYNLVFALGSNRILICALEVTHRDACYGSKWGMCPNNILTGTSPASRISCPTAGPIRRAGLPR